MTKLKLTKTDVESSMRYYVSEPLDKTSQNQFMDGILHERERLLTILAEYLNDDAMGRLIP